mgnify:CR=1 FL=1
MVLIACSAVFFGVVFDLVFEINDNVLSQHNHQHIHDNVIYIFFTALFGVIMANAYYSKLRKNISDIEISGDYNNNHAESLDLVVKGMTCRHCKESVESSIKSIHSNAETSIDLSSGKVQIKGLNLDELGF